MLWGTPLSIVLQTQQDSCPSLLTPLYPVLCMLNFSQAIKYQWGCTSVLGRVSGFPGLSGSTLFPFYGAESMAGDPGKGSNLTTVLLVRMEGKLRTHPALLVVILTHVSLPHCCSARRSGDLSPSHSSLQGLTEVWISTAPLLPAPPSHWPMCY